jgi:lysophospholipase L1-like esterase
MSQGASAENVLTGESYFAVRGGLDNCRVTFQNEKAGRVAYLGGSITASTGWRDLTYDLLKERFPETKFDFVNAGIGGTDSTLGAFRLEEHVFKNGPVDLLFLEYAVNDGPGIGTKRAMEGIIRHARRLNPKLDIIVQYFVDQGKRASISKGEVPQVIADHDAVVAHYNLPTLNLAREMTRRLDAGEFTWEEFSRDSCHPLPMGHKLYADCIAALLDAAWANPPTSGGTMVEYPLPSPLDAMNYENGRFIELDQAKILDGWKRDAAWDASKKCNYGGKVDVLVGHTPGATLELAFEGSLVGIYAIAGMDAGMLAVRIDEGDPKTLDMFDHYCAQFHRPVCHLLGTDLKPGKHVLTLRVLETQNEKSQGHATRILRFVAN